MNSPKWRVSADVSSSAGILACSFPKSVILGTQESYSLERLCYFGNRREKHYPSWRGRTERELIWNLIWNLIEEEI